MTQTHGRKRRIRLAQITIAVSVAAVVSQALDSSVAPGGSTQEAGAADTRVIGPLSPPSGAWFGVMANADRTNSIGTEREVDNLESEIGRPFDIDHRFFPFGNSFGELSMVKWDLANGRIPMITLGPGDAQDIANGQRDGYLREQAQKIAVLDGKVFFRFFHEMDGDNHKALAHSPTTFINAWRRVHNIFEDAGADNAVWVWCPTSWGFDELADSPRPQEFYPGDSYVDWVAADAYNWFPKRDDSRWRSLRTRLVPFYDWAITKQKPIMVAEYGVMEDTGQPPEYPNAHPGRKAFWIESVQVNLPAKMPAIQAVIYYDTARVYPWNVRSSDSSINAFRTMANSSWFNPKGR